MEKLEDIEVKGISIRLFVTIIICTGSIVISIFQSYTGLKAEIESLRSSTISETKLNELRIRTIEAKLSTMELSIKELSDKYDRIIINLKQ